MKTTILCPFSIALLGAISQISTAQPVSIESLVQEAMEHNPERLLYIAEIAVTKGNRTAAGKLANPEFSAEVGGKSTRGPDLHAEGVAWAVSLSQTFEWPGRIGLRKAIANRDIQLAELGLERFTAALMARVRTLAFKTFASKEREVAAREVAERFQSLREVMVQRDPAGVTPKLELRVIEATTLTLRREAADTALERKKAAIELNLLLGRSPGDEIAVQAPSVALDAIPSFKALTELAHVNNFDLKLKTAELEQQGFRVALAKNERFPSVTVRPMFSQEKSDARDRIVGVGISVPLPLWNRNEGNIAAAEAKKKQAEALLRAATIEIERQIAEASATYEARREEIADWKPESIDAFREAAALADKHFRQGAVSSAIYLELQQKYLEAVATLLTAKEEAMASRLKVEELTGSKLGASKREGR